MSTGRLMPGILAVLQCLLISSCSEEAAPLQTQDARAAQSLVASVAEQFPVLQPLLERALPVHQVDDRYLSNPRLTEEEVDGLTGKGGVWRKPGNHRLVAQLPARASGVTRISNGPVTLEVRAVGITDAAASRGENALVYKDAYPGADSLVLAERERVEEFILLKNARAPRRFTYELSVVRGGGQVRQLEPGLPVEVLDSQGNAWLRLARPWVKEVGGEKREARVKLDGLRLSVEVPEDLQRYPILVDPGWTTTGGMASKRSEPTSTRLLTGKVLVAGGYDGVMLSSSELYDPKTGTWTATGSMGTERWYHKAMILGSGKVLVVGGYSSSGRCSSAELFEPTTGKWTATGSMGEARVGPTATLLGTGKVLVAGGEGVTGHRLSSVELYDPATGKWSATAKMNVDRAGHRATLLGTGKVLVSGGG